MLTQKFIKIFQSVQEIGLFSLFQNLNLGNASTNPKRHLTIPWATSCQYQCIGKILSKYSKRFKSYRHFSRTGRGQNLHKQSKDKIFTNSPRTKSSQTVRWQNQMLDYRALYEIQLQVSVDFLRVVQYPLSKVWQLCATQFYWDHILLKVIFWGNSTYINTEIRPRHYIFSSDIWWPIYEPRHDETNKVTVRPAKTQISLGIRPVWSVFAVRLIGS